MLYSLDIIKSDLKSLSEKEFYTKHIVRSDNWYFENYMKKSADDFIKISDDYRLVISEKLGVSFNSVMMVGSGKIGFSLSPESTEINKETKLFLPFCSEGKERKISDIDIAIISNDIFHNYWSLFRRSYKTRYENTYLYVYRGLYRGYIDERNITEVDGCRKIWNETANASKSILYSDLYFKHEIRYRIYRSWEDFEEYNIQNISRIKRSVQL